MYIKAILFLTKRGDFIVFLFSLAEGVENAAVVCCFITSDYQKSEDCKLELRYAQKRHKRIIPCVLEDVKTWKPCSWLELITIGLKNIDFDDISESIVCSKARELIDRIKEQLSVSQHQLSKIVDQPRYLFELIRHEYQRHSRIERIMNPSKSFPIEQSYVNLAIVETKEQQLKEKKLLGAKHNSDTIGTYEEIYDTKTNIEIKDMFQGCNDHTKKVLVFGRAGIGKTTFCRYVTYQWATGTIWQEYDLVILFHLRNLTESRYPPLAAGIRYSLIDLVKPEYFPEGLSEKEEVLLKDQFKNSQVLWLLDGYDEIVQNTPQNLQYLYEQLLRTPHHILTSRPYSNTLSYNVQLEITGFTNDNIKEYVEQFFDQTKNEMDDASIEAEKLMNFLKFNPKIWGIGHIPVNLELICSVWCDTDWSETTTLTMTTMYDKMTEWLCRRHLERRNVSSNQMAKNDVYARCQKLLIFLESLAFNGMESNSIILRPKLLQLASNESECSLYNDEHLLNIGILKSTDCKPIGTCIEADKNHYFVHLSFQEHFAARYLVKALKGGANRRRKAIDFINAHKYNQRFELLLTFTSGLLNDSNNQQAINLFWETLWGEPLDLIGLRHVQIVISCIDETDYNRNLPRFGESMNAVVKWINYFASQCDFDEYYNPLPVSLKRSPSLINQTEVLDTFTKLFMHKRPGVKEHAYWLISTLSVSNPPSDLIRSCLTALTDDNTKVRCSACRALGSLGERAATNKIINGLLGSLRDRHKDVRSNVCKALGKMGEKAATNEIINQLVSALRDNGVVVRCYACKALGNMGEKAATNEIINGLISLLGDDHALVRNSACGALGKIWVKKQQPMK